MKLNGSVNIGFCQGVLKKPVKIIDKDVAIVGIEVLDNHINPKINRPNKHKFHFFIRGENAVNLITDTRYGKQILVSYRLGTHFRFDYNLGIGRFETQYEIESFCYKDYTKKDLISFLNYGFYQCEFLEVSPVFNAKNMYNIDTVGIDSTTRKRMHLSFIAFGPYGEKIKELYKPGDEITVLYRLERRKNKINDGGVEYFTNCILEKIV